MKFTRLTAGCAISAATTFGASAGALEITLTTPFGKPASFMIWPIRRWVAGQTSDDLRITVLPQASGAAIARTPRITGAFHGAIPRTTPAGCRTASEITPGLSAGMISPTICVVRPAASRSMLAAKWTLKPAQGAVAPISSIIGWVNSPARASSKSAALSRSARRSPGPVCDQAGKRPRRGLDDLGGVGLVRRRRFARDRARSPDRGGRMLRRRLPEPPRRR